MGFLPKKWLNRIWGVEQPKTQFAKPLECDACHIARANGSDACWEHHAAHLRAHTYHVGHEMNWSSGIDGVDSNVESSPMPGRVSATSIH